MATTVKEVLEGVLLQDVSNELSDVQDAIDFLSESKIKLMPQRDTIRKIGIDGNVVTAVDKYGDLVAATADANYQDRTYLKDTYSMIEPTKITYTIPRQDLDLYGITPAILSAPANSVSESQIASMSAAIKAEWDELNKGKMRTYRRKQLRDALIALGRTGQTNPCLPLGLKIVDTAGSRTTAWTFTNKGTAALTTTVYKEVVNLFVAGQYNANNREYGISSPLWLLHAADFSLAESIHLPNDSVETQKRTPGGSYVPISAKSVSVYGDGTNTDDFIVLGKNHQIYRIARKDAGTASSNGLSARMYFIESNGALRIELYNHSEIVIDSPIDIFKAVV